MGKKRARAGRGRRAFVLGQIGIRRLDDPVACAQRRQTIGRKDQLQTARQRARQDQRAGVGHRSGLPHSRRTLSRPRRRGTDGTRLGDELARIGYAGDMVPGSLVPQEYLELHIEQGPVLEAEGRKEAAFRAINALEIIKISNNLGDSKSIATHPATTTHQRLPQDQKDALGITPGLIRLSLGIEDGRDLVADIERALASICRPRGALSPVALGF